MMVKPTTAALDQKQTLPALSTYRCCRCGHKRIWRRVKGTIDHAGSFLQVLR